MRNENYRLNRETSEENNRRKTKTPEFIDLRIKQVTMFEHFRSFVKTDEHRSGHTVGAFARLLLHA